MTAIRDIEWEECLLEPRASPELNPSEVVCRGDAGGRIERPLAEELLHTGRRRDALLFRGT